VVLEKEAAGPDGSRRCQAMMWHTHILGGATTRLEEATPSVSSAALRRCPLGAMMTAHGQLFSGLRGGHRWGARSVVEVRWKSALSRGKMGNAAMWEGGCEAK
jgi:hypothetical protein